MASVPDAQDIVILTLALGSAVSVGAVDIYAAQVTGEVEGALILQVSDDGSVWTNAGPAVPVYATARQLRLPVWPDQVAPRTHVRIVLVDGNPVTGETLSGDGVSVMAASVPDTNVRFWPFSGPEGLAYMLAVTGRNADVYRNGVYLASVPLPYRASQLARVRRSKRLDTLLAFHENVAPHRVFRDGGDFSWISEPAALENVPFAQFEDSTYTNGTNEIQRINFSGFAANDTFNILLDGERTGSITIPDQYTNVEVAVRNALEALDVLGPNTITATRSGTREVTVEFIGEAGQKDWPEMFVSVTSGTDGSASVSTVQEGEEGGEPLVSEARGWFRCGMFWSGRTNLIGAKSFPLTAIASQFGDYFNFEQASSRATDGLEYLIDAEDDDGVRAVVRDQYPLLFTTSSVFYLPVDALDGGVPPGATLADGNGFEDTIEPQRLDGGTIYVQQGGTVVRELIWVGREAGGYDTQSISTRASHLIQSPIDACVRPAGRRDTTGAYMLVRGDGELASFISQRDQQVAAWTRETTPNGKVLAVGADKFGRTYLAIAREIGDVTHWSVECSTPERYLDGSVIRTLDDSVTVDGLDHLEGLDIIVHDFDRWEGPLTVTGGAVTLAEAMDGEVEAGLFFDAFVQPLDMRVQVGGRTLANVRKRVVSVEASIEDSVHPFLRHNGKDWDMQRSDEDLRDTELAIGPLQARTTGWVEVTGLEGYARETRFSIHRAAPGPFLVRAIITEAEIQ